MYSRSIDIGLEKRSIAQPERFCYASEELCQTICAPMDEFVSTEAMEKLLQVNEAKLLGNKQFFKLHRSWNRASGLGDVIGSAFLAGLSFLAGYQISLLGLPSIMVVGAASAGVFVGVTINKAYHLSTGLTLGESIYNITHIGEDHLYL